MQKKSLIKLILFVACLCCIFPISEASEQNHSLSDATYQPISSNPIKLTAGYYSLAGATEGYDLNLRHSSSLGNAWIGYFSSPNQQISQWRTGADGSFGEAIRLAPSLQVASGGFYGGSIQVETALPWFLGFGLGRTNLKPYWNLNFDPNDSYMITAGHRNNVRTLALLYLRDNRLNPDQRHLHAYWRESSASNQRLVFDVLYKQGIVNNSTIHKWGMSINQEWNSLSIGIAYDPNANFTPDNMWRFNLGVRF